MLPAETSSKNTGHEPLPFLTALGFQASGQGLSSRESPVYTLHGNLLPAPRGQGARPACAGPALLRSRSEDAVPGVSRITATTHPARAPVTALPPETSGSQTSVPKGTTAETASMRVPGFWTQKFCFARCGVCRFGRRVCEPMLWKARPWNDDAKNS